ncbi:MAG: hypothetical protein HY831_04030 [Candidatus Aenigmarchaeota archaeon]|nr:hypothetical protein [Candidatus Aenigmarchaeota archaeon]
MVTTIQISEELKEELAKRRLFERETYEDVIWDMIEDTEEISEETKRNIERSKKDIEEGRTYSLEEVRKRFNL